MQKLTFKPTISLAEIIRDFSIPMRVRWEKEYPTLQAWGDWLFWSVIEDAISREGRIQPNAVKAAVADASRVAP
jgi:hypothetical protein